MGELVHRALQGEEVGHLRRRARIGPGVFRSTRTARSSVRIAGQA